MDYSLRGGEMEEEIDESEESDEAVLCVMFGRTFTRTFYSLMIFGQYTIKYLV